jgi:hypothetical protein
MSNKNKMTEEEKQYIEAQGALQKALIGEQFYSWMQHPYTIKLFEDLEKFRDLRSLDAENQLDSFDKDLTLTLLVESRMIRNVIKKLKTPIEVK